MKLAKIKCSCGNKVGFLYGSSKIDHKICCCTKCFMYFLHDGSSIVGEVRPFGIAKTYCSCDYMPHHLLYSYNSREEAFAVCINCSYVRNINLAGIRYSTYITDNSMTFIEGLLDV